MEGERAAQTAAEVIQALTSVLEDASDRSRQIASTAVQQSSGTEQIREAAASLSEASREGAASTAQIKEASVTLADVGLQLRQFIGGKESV